MRASKTPKITPDGPPISTVSEERVWSELVPRLLSPDVLAIIHTLLGEGRPLPLSELAERAEVSVDRVRDHCKAMDRKGVLEVTGVIPRADGDGEEPTYFFRKGPVPAAGTEVLGG